jgi:hypothetical protein
MNNKKKHSQYNMSPLPPHAAAQLGYYTVRRQYITTETVFIPTPMTADEAVVGALTCQGIIMASHNVAASRPLPKMVPEHMLPGTVEKLLEGGVSVPPHLMKTALKVQQSKDAKAAAKKAERLKKKEEKE